MLPVHSGTHSEVVPRSRAFLEFFTCQNCAASAVGERHVSDVSAGYDASSLISSDFKCAMAMERSRQRNWIHLWPLVGGGDGSVMGEAKLHAISASWRLRIFYYSLFACSLAGSCIHGRMCLCFSTHRL